MNDFDNKQICSYKDIDRFGFTCDVCGRKVNGCSIVNGMKFCAKCYQETFCKDNQQNEIQQLKQQLAEKDKEIDRLKDFIGCKGCVDVIKKSNEDQKQLAIQELEKVKEWLEPKYFDYEQINYLSKIIDQQIKELKGDKDEAQNK